MSSFFGDEEFEKLIASGNVTNAQGSATRTMDQPASAHRVHGIHLEDAKLQLREFAAAFAAGDVARAKEIAKSVPATPEARAAGAAHVLSVGAGLLDAWGTDSALRSIVRGASAPKWTKASRKAAQDVLALAPKGRVLDSLDKLTSNHGDTHLLEGIMLAAAAALGRVAKRETSDLAEVAERLLPVADISALPDATIAPAAPAAPVRGTAADEAAAASAPVSGTFGNGTVGNGGARNEVLSHLDGIEADVPNDPLFQAFAAWLRGAHDGLDDDDDLLAMTTMIFTTAGAFHFDLTTPDGVVDLLEEHTGFAGSDALTPEESEQFLQTTIAVLDDFVRFQMETGTEPETWTDVHHLIEAAGVEADPMMSALLGVAGAAQNDSAEVRAALLSTGLVQGIRSLLEWIGDSRPVTAKGWVKQADIAPAAAFFGIDAAGARSAGTVPVLSQVWSLLSGSGLLEVGPKKAIVSEAGQEWLRAEGPEAHAMASVAEVVIVDLLDELIGQGEGDLGRASVAVLVERITQMAAPDAGITSLEFSDARIKEQVGEVLDEAFSVLHGQGLLTTSAGGEFGIEPGLRGVVARAVLAYVGAPGFDGSIDSAEDAA